MIALAEVYRLPLTSLHVFFDLEGGLIAFNRNGSVFFNLRYYEAWRKHQYAFSLLPTHEIHAQTTKML